MHRIVRTVYVHMEYLHVITNQAGRDRHGHCIKSPFRELNETKNILNSSQDTMLIFQEFSCSYKEDVLRIEYLCIESGKGETDRPSRPQSVLSSLLAAGLWVAQKFNLGLLNKTGD